MAHQGNAVENQNDTNARSSERARQGQHAKHERNERREFKSTAIWLESSQPGPESPYQSFSCPEPGGVSNAKVNGSSTTASGCPGMITASNTYKSENC
jgi:hypothetical protein